MVAGTTWSGGLLITERGHAWLQGTTAPTPVHETGSATPVETITSIACPKTVADCSAVRSCLRGPGPAGSQQGLLLAEHQALVRDYTSTPQKRPGGRRIQRR